MKRIRVFSPLFIVCVLILVSLSCSLFTARAVPTGSGQSHQIETLVAATVSAFDLHKATAAPPQANLPAVPTSAEEFSAPTTTPTNLPGVLPAGLYFLGPDRYNLDQVWRLSPQGKALEQETQEGTSVTNFAVSPDGKLAYIVNNQLVLKRPGYSGTAVIVDGGKDDGTDIFRFTDAVGGLAWSPDGQMLAFGQGGIHLLDLSTGKQTLVLKNDFQQQGSNAFARKLYSPIRWSPDNSRLIVGISYYEGGTMGIYNPKESRLVEFKKSNGDPVSCCTVSWTADSQEILSAGFLYGGTSADLWRYTAVDGTGKQLIPARSADGTYNYLDWPILGGDGKLYYFYTGQSTPASGPVPYQMVRSNTDGLTGRTVLQSNPLYLTEVLWAPDASLALGVQMTPGETPAYGTDRGPVLLIPSDGGPTPVLIHEGFHLAWGP